MDIFCSVSRCITANFSENRPQMCKKKRGTIVEERRDTNEEIIIPRICLGLLSVMGRDNKQTKKNVFTGQFLTVTNTHFNRLQIYG